MNKTNGKGDCCMLTVVEWGHSRLMCEEHPEDFEDEDHMNYVGEFYFKVNETCLHGDHNIFMVAPNDRDAHNPILIHLDLLICHGMNDIITNRAYKKKQYADSRKEDRRRKRERHMKIKHRRIRATQSGVDPHLQRPDHGDQVSGDE